MTDARTIQKREKLEIIVDNSSILNNALFGVDLLIKHARTAKRKVFDDYRVIIPCQIATEINASLFPEFFDAEMTIRNSDSYMKQFYQQHRQHIRIEETNTSSSYKFYYAQHAIAMLRAHPEHIPQVIKMAQNLAKFYMPAIHSEPSKIDKQALDNFCSRATNSYASHEQFFGDFTLFGFNANPFFSQCSLEEKYLLQAMYIEPGLRGLIGKETDLKKFQRDKGERAIEDFLYGDNSQSDPRRVSVVLSDDLRAREHISILRKHSQNTIFTIGAYGLARALSKTYGLGLIDSMSDMVSGQVLIDIESRRKGTRNRTAPGTTPTMEQVLEPEIEEKWADRLVSVMKSGYWPEDEKAIEPRRA